MKKRKLVTDVEIVDLGAKGKVIGKKDGQVFLTKGAIPGDIADIEVRKKRKGMMEGPVMEIKTHSPYRVEPVCKHQEHCGGCSWQDMSYEQQINFKEKNVYQQLRRIGGFEHIPSEPIMGANQVFAYRNKLEFTFVKEKWLTPDELKKGDEVVKDEGCGFHVPGRFDWVLHVEECQLQEDTNNRIRNFIFEKAKELDISFYHPRDKDGVMRNIVLRNNRKGEWMLLVITSLVDEKVQALFDAIGAQFSEIKSFWSIINTKVNDTFADCSATLVTGDPHLVITLERPDEQGRLDYLLGPKSFFQTNTAQAERLYQLVYEWASIKPGERVYDLYTGIGSIALFVADKAQEVIGIEYVPEAIEDAEKNAELNGVTNCSFFAGDMKDILSAEFIEKHGKPDVMIVDPPRAGMHGDVVERILESEPARIVYVSCDPATQARDLAILKRKYDLTKTRAVDMFPHTSHVENVALLELRD